MKLNSITQAMPKISKKRATVNLISYLVLVGTVTAMVPLWNSFAVQSLFLRFCRMIFPYILYILLTMLFNMVIEKNTWKDLGYSAKHLTKQISLGGIVGICTLLVVIGIPLLLGVPLSDIVGTRLNNIFLNVIYLFFGVGFGEELMFRGYIQTKLVFLCKSKWIALIIASLLFGAWHFVLSGNILQVVFTSILGFIYGICKMKNGMVAPSVAHGFHDVGLRLIAYFFV